ncbi:MAG TPA: alpha/beta fold hydrolase [Vicinamibacteria bacterium]|nr:alpha/beta fold hydrolase [Vicinamibacteria bacterium]
MTKLARALLGTTLLTAFAANLVFAQSTAPVAKPAVTEGDFQIRDFRFDSGETLATLNLHYRTLGRPVRNARGQVTNAVLIMHGTGGTGASFLSDNFGGVLFGPGQLLDAATHYIILPDGIGHGKSTKPSDGLHAKFPRYGYGDLVTAQYRLVTEGLKVDHLRLVMGTSMGGMHTWMWATRYPDFMDAAMPLASLPVQIAGRNRFFRRMVSDAIRNDPDWKNGEYTAQPRGLNAAVYTLIFMTSVPLQWQKLAPTREAADQFFDRTVAQRTAANDANDMLYQFEASRDYNPEPDLEKIVCPLLAINSADDQVNPPELGILEAQIKRVKKGRAVIIPISDQTRGHSTHSFPAIWGGELARLLKESEPKP